MIFLEKIIVRTRNDDPFKNLFSHQPWKKWPSMGKIITLVNSSEMIKMMCICFSNSAKYTQWLKINRKVSFYNYAKELQLLSWNEKHLHFRNWNETFFGRFQTHLQCSHVCAEDFFSLYFHNKITQFSLKIRSFFNKRKEEQIFVLSYNQCIFEGYSVFKKTITWLVSQYYPAFVLEGERD